MAAIAARRPTDCFGGATQRSAAIERNTWMLRTLTLFLTSQASAELEMDVQSPTSPNAPSDPRGAPNDVLKISTLLKSLDDAANESSLSSSPKMDCHGDAIAHARLGVAGGLFTALRAKHPPTASHCLRVALGCSSWGMALELPSSYRDALEVAALLHDIGKIGVPDRVLIKPSCLQPTEAAIMSRHRSIATRILTDCCANPDIIDIVKHSSTWFDGSRFAADVKGEKISLGARMLAIVDAFDAMTTDTVYRPARSRERAIAELFTFAGTQFDPELVKKFHALHASNQNELYRRVTDHWLHDFEKGDESAGWRIRPRSDNEFNDGAYGSSPFEAVLIENMHDGVMFIDSELKIQVWNTGAERLTGVSRNAATGREWKPELLDFRNESGKRISEENCPIAKSILTGVQSIQRLSIQGRSGRDVVVDLHVIPVRDDSGDIHGATVLLQDASPEASLEKRCLALHEKATKDPLTQIANRAEFDRMHQLFTDAHLESGLPCSLIISDIDRFKNINDTHGHQAGDDAIIAFAGLLKSTCRTGDLVARYGGEEFVVLCTDCNNASAAKRANEIRMKLADLKHAGLGGKSFTASFGVTELQPGDSPATMLRRADRALLLAKDQGRNRVVQLGDGMSENKEKKSWWPFGGNRGDTLIETKLITIVPMAIAIQKLRGFIADHEATIATTGDDHLQLVISGNKAGIYRREDERDIPLVIDMQFEEKHVDRCNAQGFAAGKYVETHTLVKIRPLKGRDRRRDHATDRARLMLASLKSYLMAKDKDEHAKSQQLSEVVVE